MHKKQMRLLCLLLLITFSTSNRVSAYELSGQYQNLSGQSVNFSTFQGSFLLVDAMATDCSFCQEQHPILHDVYEMYKSQIYMLTLAIKNWDNIQTVTQFVNKYSNAWSIGLDPGQAFAGEFGIGSTPTLLIFNPNGALAHKWVGLTELSEITAVIDALLGGKTSVPLGNNNGNARSNQNSIIGDIFSNPAFQVITIIFVALLIYFQLTKKPPVESK